MSNRGHFTHPVVPGIEIETYLVVERYFHGIRIHDAIDCEGHSCPFDNPSIHAMREWPMHLLLNGLVERMCLHEVGHPDPDSYHYLDAVYGLEPRASFAIHGCDGCCNANAKAGLPDPASWGQSWGQE